jgi:hypothetical protein
MHKRSAAQLLVVVLLAMLPMACGGDRDRVASIQLVGDSLFQMTERESEGYSTAECSVHFQAEVEGDEGAEAVMRGGHIEYWWWTTGGEAGSYSFGPQQLAQLWVDTVFIAGTPRRSHSHGFGQSTPAQPVRGQVVFEYGARNSDEVRETEPFRFYCY